MQSVKAGLIVAVALCAAALAAPVYAYHGHGHGHGGWHGRAHFGFYLGAPLYWNPYPYYPPYYYPPVVSAPQSPPVYVQKNEQAPASQGWWYFCRESNAYYPYVKHCPGGWQKVSPQPPAR